MFSIPSEPVLLPPKSKMFLPIHLTLHQIRHQITRAEIVIYAINLSMTWTIMHNQIW